MGRRRFDDGKQSGPPSDAKARLLRRATEAIEFLMENDGYSPLTKAEFAGALAGRFGRVWLRADGTPNRRLVEDVANLTRDQHGDIEAEIACAGYIVSYSPVKGGMTLVGLDGNMDLPHLLKMQAGDVLRQQNAKTINRRRVAIWKEASRAAHRAGDFDLAACLSQIENEIDTTGFVSDSKSNEFLQLLRVRGIELDTSDEAA